MGCPQKRGAELAGPSPNHRYRLLHHLGAALPSNFKVPLRDGDAECAEKGEEYAGHWFLNASSTRRPQIVDINRNDIWEESDVYSGCYARVCSRSGVPPARSGPGSCRVSGGNAGRSCPGVSPADSPSSDGVGVPGADRGYRLSERRGSGREHPTSPSCSGMDREAELRRS